MKTSISVLIIDDSKAHSTFLSRLLNDLTLWEIDSETCETGQQAINLINMKDRDIIFVDYYLGEETGIDVIRSFKKQGCQTSFILLTGMSNESVAINALKEGASDYLTKDQLSPEVLDRSLRHVIENKESQDALRKSQISLKEAQELAHLGNWDWDIEKNTIYWSDEIYRIFGLKPNEFEANYETFLNIIHPEDRELVTKSVDNALNENKPYSIEHRIILPDKTERTVNEKSKVYFDKAGKPIRMVGTVQDITERRKADEKLHLASKVFENTAEAIMITDAKANILEINDAFSVITGFSRREAIGQNPRILKSGKHKPEFYEKMWKTIIEEGKWQGEIWDRRKDGEIFPKWMTINSVKNENGDLTHYISIFSDITSRKQTEEQLQFLAHYDALTNLPNRILFNDRLTQAIIQAKRDNCVTAVMFLDLDRFKKINDTLGHDVGDELLKQVALRLKTVVRKADTISRLGGDEFTIILPGIINNSSVSNIAQKIIDSFTKHFTLGKQVIYITTSIGIAIFPSDSDNTENLIKNADTAMYHAKRMGKNNYQFFSYEMNIKAIEQLDLELSLRRALDNQEFVLYYQPQIDFNTGKVVGAEALLRWSPSKHGLVPPGKFIPLAEETGLIIPISEWVLETACKQGKMWHDNGFPIRVGVNLSSLQFKQNNLVSLVTKTLEKTSFDHNYLELEITEGILIDDIDKTIDILNEIKKMGIFFAIDDFGTGYSSLSYLKRFPIDTLKIDKSFVHDITTDPDASAITIAIISMGHSLNMTVIAEGVETSEHVDFLRKQQCNIAQGFFYSPALPADQFFSFIKENKNLIDQGVEKM